MITIFSDKTNKEFLIFQLDQDRSFEEYRADVKNKITNIKSLFANGKELEIIIKWIKAHNEQTIPFMQQHCTWHGDMANFIFDNLD